MFCTKCGNSVVDDAKFCTNCGNVLSQDNSAEETSQVAPQEMVEPVLEETSQVAPNETTQPTIDNEVTPHVVEHEYKKSSNVGIKVFLGFVALLFVVLIVALVMLIMPKEPEYEIEDYYGVWEMHDTKANTDNINGKKDKGEFPEGVEDIYLFIDNDDEVVAVEIYEDGTVNEVIYEIDDFDEYIVLEYDGDDVYDGEYRIIKDEDELLISLWSGKKAYTYYSVYEESKKEYEDLFDDTKTLEFAVSTESSSEESSGGVTKYEEDVYLIGSEIPAGVYKLYSTSTYGGYFETTADGGEDSDIISNSVFDEFTYVLMKEGEYIALSRCYAVEISDATPFDADSAGGKYSGDALYKVGFDIPAGQYKLIPNHSEYSGYYHIYSKPDIYDYDSLIEFDGFDEEIIITVDEGQYLICDFGDIFELDGEVETATKTNTDDSTKYEDGLYLIGTDIPAGEYKLYADGSYGGYYVITDDGGEDSDIIKNSYFYDFSYAILSEGKYISIQGCYAVPISDATPYDLHASGGVYVEDSTYRVGLDLEAGNYKLISNDDDLSGMAFVYSTDDFSMIDYYLVEGEENITLEEGSYFNFTYCDLVKVDGTSATETETETETKAEADLSGFTFVEDSCYGLAFEIPVEFEKSVSDYTYYYFDGPLGFIMLQPSSEFGVNTLSDLVWDSFVEGLVGSAGYKPLNIADENITIAGVDGRIHRFILEIQGIEYMGITAGFIKDGDFYNVSIIAEEFYMKEYYPVFQEVLKTIEVE